MSHVDLSVPVACLQYGFVNSALEKLVQRRFGREKWDEIRFKNTRTQTNAHILCMLNVVYIKESYNIQYSYVRKRTVLAMVDVTISMYTVIVIKEEVS